MDEKLIYYHVGQNIKETRDAADKTQEELAQALGVSRASVANYESGKQAISLSDLYKIADYFNVDINKLIPNMDLIKEKSTPEKRLEKDTSLKRKEKNEIKSFIKDVLKGGDNEK